MTVKYTYNGTGYLPEIPARDLEQADIDALTEAQKATLAEHMKLEQGRIYDVATPKTTPASGEE